MEIRNLRSRGDAKKTDTKQTDHSQSSGSDTADKRLERNTRLFRSTVRESLQASTSTEHQLSQTSEAHEEKAWNEIWMDNRISKLTKHYAPYKGAKYERTSRQIYEEAVEDFIEVHGGKANREQTRVIEPRNQPFGDSTEWESTQADQSAPYDQSEESHEPSPTDKGKGKQKVLYGEQREIEDTRQEQRENDTNRTKEVKRYWEKDPKDAAKLQESKAAKGDIELEVIDHRVKKQDHRKHERIKDPKQKAQRKKDLIRIKGAKQKWKNDPTRAGNLKELKDAKVNVDKELGILEKYRRRRL